MQDSETCLKQRWGERTLAICKSTAVSCSVSVK